MLELMYVHMRETTAWNSLTFSGAFQDISSMTHVPRVGPEAVSKWVSV